jgi:hypothetical protein
VTLNGLKAALLPDVLVAAVTPRPAQPMTIAAAETTSLFIMNSCHSIRDQAP